MQAFLHLHELSERVVEEGDRQKKKKNQIIAKCLQIFIALYSWLMAFLKLAQFQIVFRSESVDGLR